MRIVFALIAHTSTPLVIRQIGTLLKSGQQVVVHYDGKRPASDFEQLQEAFRSNPGVRFADRVSVAWAEWSVVQATLNCLYTIEAAGWDPDYVYLLSGLDYPIRPWQELLSFLERNCGDEFIESVPSNTTKWVKSGPQKERYQYYWVTNWRESPQLSDRILAVQKRLGLKRRFVRDYAPHLGSQWWVLTWQTLKEIIGLSRQDDIREFFKTTLVPDELFFQTLVRTFVPDEKIIGCTLTLYQFTDYGYPVVYHSDHIDYLVRQRFFMARKLSPHDSTLRDLLDHYWEEKRAALPFRDEDVGIRTSEYEDWRLTHRSGTPNTPLIASSGQGWAAASRRTSREAMCVVGSSLLELSFLQSLIRRSTNLVVHGQLFHPRRIEFVDDVKDFAGYTVKDVQLRDSARPEFFLDVIRARPKNASAFILRSGQAGPFADTLMQQANVKTVFVKSDPIIAFSENLGGLLATTDDASIEKAAGVTPVAAANRFRVFLKEHQQQTRTMERQFDTAKKSKPKNWALLLDVCGKGVEWLSDLRACLGFNIDLSNDGFASAKADVAAVMERRCLEVKTLLMDGGIDQAVFDVLSEEPDNTDLAMYLV